MFASHRVLTRGVFATMALFALLSSGDVRPAGVEPAAAPAAQGIDDATASLRPEVRLRKLHLVRPDLIPYPLQYDIIC